MENGIWDALEQKPAGQPNHVHVPVSCTSPPLPALPQSPPTQVTQMEAPALPFAWSWTAQGWGHGYNSGCQVSQERKNRAECLCEQTRASEESTEQGTPKVSSRRSRQRVLGRIKEPELSYLIYLPIPTLSQTFRLSQPPATFSGHSWKPTRPKQLQKRTRNPWRSLARKRWLKPAACAFPAHKHRATENSNVSEAAAHTRTIPPCPGLVLTAHGPSSSSRSVTINLLQKH